VEALNVKGLAAGMLAKHVSDAAWRQLVSMIDYKAVNAGGQIVYVDPRGTSQEWPECGLVGDILGSSYGQVDRVGCCRA
jgi:putative transposase